LRKASDWIARIGGDEFVIILPETTLPGASAVARKLRRLLASQPVLTVAGPVNFMASIGITAVDSANGMSPPSASELLQTADRNLYTSKRVGSKHGLA
jgi:diguanylate cyclase (GGDEF)-like protein